VASIATHVASIATHVAGIATHVASIATHVASISTHVASIATHVASIATHVATSSALQEQILSVKMTANTGAFYPNRRVHLHVLTKDFNQFCS
jgi:lysylphosphatidylglycerol synthetase-like protein (DUF2156 family)